MPQRKYKENIMSDFSTQPAVRVHRGVLSLEMVIVLAVIAISAITIFLNAGGLFGKNDINAEMSNTQEIAVNTRRLLKDNGLYTFNNATDMTGTLIKFGGAPGSMSVIGARDSGTATLQNIWSGAVTVEPATAAGGKTGFTVTTNLVPMTACTTLASKLSQSFGETAINGSKTVGIVNSATAGAQCTKDNGSAGTNTLRFTSMT